MGYKLRRQFQEELEPGRLTRTERLVLLEIADLANDDTRVARFGPDYIAERLDMTPLAVRKSVQRLAAKGIELRIQLGESEKGEPVFAYHGKQTNYRVPSILKPGQVVHPSVPSRVDRLSTLSKGKGWTESTAKGGQKSGEGWTESARRVDRLSTPSPHVSSVPSTISSPPKAPSSPSAGAPATLNTDPPSDDNPWAVAATESPDGNGLWPSTIGAVASSAEAPASPPRAANNNTNRIPEPPKTANDPHAFEAVTVVEQIGGLVPTLTGKELASIGHAYADRRRAGIPSGPLADSLRRVISSDRNGAEALLEAIRSVAAA